MRIATVSDSDALHVRAFAVHAKSYAFVHKMYSGFPLKILAETKESSLFVSWNTDLSIWHVETEKITIAFPTTVLV